MISLLAETTQYTSNQLGVWIAISLAVLVGAVNIKQLLTRKPPLHQEFASKVEHDKLEERVTGMDDKFTKHIADMDDKFTKRIIDMDDKFDARLVESSKSEALSRKNLYVRVEQMDRDHNARLDDLDKRIDAIPQRVLELLNITRQYHKQ
jgi:hypothetical protein